MKQLQEKHTRERYPFAVALRNQLWGMRAPCVIRLLTLMFPMERLAQWIGRGKNDSILSIVFTSWTVLVPLTFKE